MHSVMSKLSNVRFLLSYKLNLTKSVHLSSDSFKVSSKFTFVLISVIIDHLSTRAISHLTIIIKCTGKLVSIRENNLTLFKLSFFIKLTIKYSVLTINISIQRNRITKFTYKLENILIIFHDFYFTIFK